MFGYAGAAFTVYATWCEAIRGVDPGIGDGWQVPVGNDHYFCMIDVPEEGYLLKGGCSGAALVDGITLIGSSDDLVFGNSKSNGPRSSGTCGSFARDPLATNLTWTADPRARETYVLILCS